MKIETLADLKKLIALCRKTGVSSIEIDGILLTLGSEPVITKASKKQTKTTAIDQFGEISGIDRIETPDALTPEQLMMWSVGGGAANEN